MSTAKYRELFLLTKELLFREHDRFARIDQKAASYLTAFTILLPAITYFANWTVGNVNSPVHWFDIALLAVAFMMLAAATWTWVTLFRVLKLTTFRRIPLSDEIITFFDNNKQIDIYYALARGNKEAYRYNVSIADQKASRLAQAYRRTLLTLAMIVVFAVLYALSFWMN